MYNGSIGVSPTEVNTIMTMPRDRFSVPFFFVRKNWDHGVVKFMIFPYRFDTEENESLLEETRQRDQNLAEFWDGLRHLQIYFQEHHRLPDYEIDNRGYYSIVQ